MSSKFLIFLGALICSVLACAQEVAGENKIDEALQAEVRYVEALVNYGFPDLAEPLIEATKKKWPESETLFFAIEIRGMLSLGKFDEAQAKIAALPDRKGSKYWAARLEVANNYFARGNKTECAAIYSEFFKLYPTPPKELREFYLQASYAWGQILIGNREFEKAAKTYEGLLKQLNKKTNDEEANTWCNVACETAEMYLQLATEKENVEERKKYLQPAKVLVDELLWEQGRPIYFGRAIAMKANIELLNGNVAKAQETIDEYMSQLADLHASIKEYDPDGRQGLLKQSPMPLCRYLLADMLWKEAQKEYKKPKRNDERVKSLLFGEKKKNGKRNNSGAFNHALNVFVQYPESSWASRAGELSEEIRTFAETKYDAKIKTTVTPEQLAKVREMQFRIPFEKYAEQQYEEAIKEYLEVLSSYPESQESIRAIENIVSGYLNLIARKRGKPEQIEEWRMNADAVSGYLADRFAGNSNRAVMTDAGDALIRLAALEKQFGEIARADKLYKAFMIQYRNHANAAIIASSLAGEAQRAEKYEDALALWKIVEEFYAESQHFTTALINASVCQEKLGNREQAIELLNKYVATEKGTLKRVQGQMRLAKLYQEDGLEMFNSAETNEVAEAVNEQLKKGSTQILRAIGQYKNFAAVADKQLADPKVSAGDKKNYLQLKEAAMYLSGDCWSRLTKPEEKLTKFRQNSVEAFKEYVTQYPTGQYAKYAYLKMATIYTALGLVEESKNALAQLSKSFPDSDEAKNAKPRLAKALIEIGKVKEGTEIYAEMLKIDAAYTAGQFVNAGEALILAKDWYLADQAFNKAIAKAGTNQLSTVARARLGQAMAQFKQKALGEARNQLDLFLSDEKMKNLAIAVDANLLLVEVASEQGRTEKNDQLRVSHFNAAVGAVKKLRSYYRSKPQHEQDKIDLMSVDVVMKRIAAEDAMGLKEQAIETCRTAAAMVQTFLQTKEPSESLPFDKMSAGEQANLEEGYAKAVPLFSRLGADQADRVIRYGEAYLKYFPNGKNRTDIVNCINRAKSSGVLEGEKQ